METCAEQGGVHCPQGQQTLQGEINWIRITFSKLLFQPTFICCPPECLLIFRARCSSSGKGTRPRAWNCVHLCGWTLFTAQCTSLNTILALFHFSAINMLTWWYSRMLPSLSDTVLIWISHWSISDLTEVPYHLSFDTFDMISLTCFRTPAFCSFSSSRTFLQWCKAYQERESKINKS